MKNCLQSNLHILRALGNYRSVDQFTYAAIRLLLKQSDNSNFWNQDLELLLSEKLQSSTKWRFRSFPRLKKISSGIPEYIEWLSPSPLTALAESYLLSWIANHTHYVPHSANFSYNFGNSRSAASFQYYYPLYRNRDKNVLAALSRTCNSVAVVMDVSKYYPSCRKEFVLTKTSETLQKVMQKNETNLVMRFAEAILSESNDGIPIGPAFGHFLGSLFLHDFDQSMHAKYPGNYFRYVDDFIVVCRKEDSQSVIEDAATNLDKLSLKLNFDKVDVVELKEWQGWLEQCHRRERAITFEDCVSAISLTSVLFPRKVENLEKQLVNILLPTQKIRSVASNPRFQWFGYMQLYWDYLRRYHRSKFSKIIKEGFVKPLFKVRDNLMTEMTELRRSLQTKSKPTQRRWWVQRLKYVVSRLAYLVPVNNFEDILNIAQEFEELGEISTILKAIWTNDISDLVRLPGRAQSAFAELQLARKSPKLPVLIANNTSAELESYCNLVLRGAVEVDYATTQTDNQHEFPLRLVSGNRGLIIKNDKFSDNYWREIEWLFANLDIGNSLTEVFETRWSCDERPELDLATLSGIDYYL